MLSKEEQIFSQIEKAKNILLVFNKNWEEDAVSSALALALVLKKMGKKVKVLADKKNKHSACSFLPMYKKIENVLDIQNKFIISLSTKNAKIKQVKYENKKDKVEFIIESEKGDFSKEDVKAFNSADLYDLIITLASPDLESLGEIYDRNTKFFYETPIINIDFHSENEKYGQINYIDLLSVSCTDVLFNLIKKYKENLVDEEVATCLLTGVITRTKNFKTNNLTPNSLANSSEMIRLGARRDEILDNFYRSKSFGVLKLWGRVLARLDSSRDDKILWSVLSKMDFEKTNTTEKDVAEVIDELIVNIPRAELVIIFYEINSSSKALLYATKNIDLFQVLQKWNYKKFGKDMATVLFDKPILEIKDDFLKEIFESVKL